MEGAYSFSVSERRRLYYLQNRVFGNATVSVEWEDDERWCCLVGLQT